MIGAKAAVLKSIVPLNLPWCCYELTLSTQDRASLY